MTFRNLLEGSRIKGELRVGDIVSINGKGKFKITKFDGSKPRCEVLDGEMPKRFRLEDMELINESGFKKGDTFSNKNGVSVKIIQIKDVPGVGEQYRVELLSGLNKGNKTWYTKTNLETLFDMNENEIKFQALATMKEIHASLAELTFVDVIAVMREDNPLKKDVNDLEKQLNELTTKVGNFVTDNLEDAVEMEQADIEDAEKEKEEQKDLEIKKSQAVGNAIANGKNAEKDEEQK